jgi:hypothetical protein
MAYLTDTMYQQYVYKRITFAGGTANAIGDHDGTGDPFTIATVSGIVAVKVLAIGVVDLAIDGGATLEVGVAGDTAEIIAQTAGDAIDAGEIWHDNTPDSKCETLTVLTEKLVANTNIIGTVATANITAGSIDFYVFWYPLTNGATVTV